MKKLALLLVAGVAVIVLATDLIGRKDEVVDAERLRVECAANLAHHAAGPFGIELADIHEVVSTH